MADRRFHDVAALDRDCYDLEVQVALNGNGAPSIGGGHAKGVASVARTAAGTIKLTLADYCAVPLMVDAEIEVGGGTPANGYDAQVGAIALTSRAAGAPTVTILTLNEGVATDCAAGNTLQVSMRLSNASNPKRV